MNTRDHYTAKAMKKWGGSFVQQLANLAEAADPDNLVVIKRAWPGYWAKYEELGKTIELEEVSLSRSKETRERLTQTFPAKGDIFY